MPPQFVPESSPNRSENAALQNEKQSPTTEGSSYQAQNRETLTDDGKGTTFHADSMADLCSISTERSTNAALGNKRPMSDTLTGDKQRDLFISSSKAVVDARYEESAVHSLLALGHPTTGSPPLESTNEITPAQINQTSQGTNLDSPRSSTSITTCNTSSVISPGRPTPVRSEVSTERILELLRHYRYEVAPWVSFDGL